MASDPAKLRYLSEAQRAVVDHNRGPMLVLAGPGTGKTTTIVEAIVARLAASAKVDSSPTHEAYGQPPVLVLTFGRAAADELRERIARRIGNGVLPTVSTFHAFSYAILREFSPVDEFGSTPRLIDAADQDARLRELLTSAVREGRVPWPKELDAALGTQGLAQQVRELLARAQLLGFDERALKRVARESGIPTWEALADFLGEYLDVLDAAGVLDYSELIHRAVMLASEPEVAAVLARRYSAIYVDEYQDTDPAQVQLLQALTTPASTLVAVGDPDQAIYGFRGADVKGILRFRDDFPAESGNPAPIIVLRESHRFGADIAKAAGRVISGVSLAGLPAAIQRDHRDPKCMRADPGTVEVVTFDSESAQAAAVADRIRRLRLTGQVGAWKDIAVIVRSAVRQLPLLVHALETAGVPVQMAGDELPLREHRAVEPLLGVLSASVDVGWLTPERTKTLLFSPMIGLDGIRFRRLGRLLRHVAADFGDQVAPTSLKVFELAVTDDEFWQRARSSLAAEDLEPVAILRSAIAAARRAADRNDPVQQVLWAVWSATDWPQRLAVAARGSGVAARAANRDLDSVVTLFAEAGRADELFGIARPVLNFVQDVQAESIRMPSVESPLARDSGDAVRLLTAHRAKGLQWSAVFIVGVQEESWPDLRTRPSLLRPDRLQVDGISDPPLLSETLAAERRLFYVACTRAQERLVVTAVSNAGQSATAGESPSRFVSELAADPAAVSRVHEHGYQLSSLHMAAVVASLRATLESPTTSIALREASAQRLARLAAHGVRAADPDSWWGVHDWTNNDRLVRAPHEPLRISGSSWSALDRCALAWFLEHEVKAGTSSGTAIAFGSIVHELADRVTQGEIEADIDVLMAKLDGVWSALGFEAAWQKEQQRLQAREALIRFLDWHSLHAGQRVIGSELGFALEVELANDRVSVNGSVDRLEMDSRGELHIFDLKTQKTAEVVKELPKHRQLALYQLAAHEGAFAQKVAEADQDADRPHPVADASLVLLRIGDSKTGLPKVQTQSALDPETVKDELAEAVARVRGEAFVPTVNKYCGGCRYQAVCPIRPESQEVTS